MAFGVKKKFMGRTFEGIHRTTYIIDENLKIQEVIKKPNTKNHTAEILEILKKN